MSEKIKEYILEGNYQLAESVCNKMNSSDVYNTVLTLAYDTESICIYSFIQYMISRANEALWIKLAIEVMIIPLCHIEGAYSAALFHARELLKLEYNAANLEMVLFFYDIPDKLIEKSEAESIAKELQRIDPDNKVALHILSGCSWTQLNTNSKDSQTD